MPIQPFVASTHELARHAVACGRTAHGQSLARPRGISPSPRRVPRIDEPPLTLDFARELPFGGQDFHVPGSKDLAGLAQHRVFRDRFVLLGARIRPIVGLSPFGRALTSNTRT